MQILDPAECDFPYRGRIIFEGFASEARAGGRKCRRLGPGLSRAHRRPARRRHPCRFAHRANPALPPYGPPARPRARRARIRRSCGNDLRRPAGAARPLAVLPPLYFILRLTPPGATAASLSPHLPPARPPAAAAHPAPPPFLDPASALGRCRLASFSASPAPPCARPLPCPAPARFCWSSIMAGPPPPSGRNSSPPRKKSSPPRTRRTAASRSSQPRIRPPARRSNIQGMFSAAERPRRSCPPCSPSPGRLTAPAPPTVLQSAPETTRLYLADGITDGTAFPAFLQALHPTRIIRPQTLPPLLGPRRADAEWPSHGARHLQPAHAAILRRIRDRRHARPAAFNAAGNAAIALPPPSPTRSPVSSWTARPPPAAPASPIPAPTPPSRPRHRQRQCRNALSRHALLSAPRAPAGAELTTGRCDHLLAQPIRPDHPGRHAAHRRRSKPPPTRLYHRRAAFWSASPARSPPPPRMRYPPTRCCSGDRRLGGALTWATPETLAPFPADTPPSPACQRTRKLTISQQILADPISARSRHRLGHLAGRHAADPRQTHRPRLSRQHPHHRQYRMVQFRVVRALPRDIEPALRPGPRRARKSEYCTASAQPPPAFGTLSLPGISAEPLSPAQRDSASAYRPRTRLASTAQAPPAIALNLGGHVYPARRGPASRTPTPLGDPAPPRQLGPRPDRHRPLPAALWICLLSPGSPRPLSVPPPRAAGRHLHARSPPKRNRPPCKPSSATSSPRTPPPTRPPPTASPTSPPNVSARSSVQLGAPVAADPRHG